MSATLDPEDDGIVMVSCDSGRSAYHTQPDCERIGPNCRPMELTKLDDKYTECDYCTDDLSRPGENNMECPYCDAVVGQLPHHLVNDCEGQQ